MATMSGDDPVDSVHELSLVFGAVGMFAGVGILGTVLSAAHKSRAEREKKKEAAAMLPAGASIAARFLKARQMGAGPPRSVLTQSTAGLWLMAAFFSVYLSARSYDQFGVFHPDLSHGSAVIPFIMALAVQLLRALIDEKVDLAVNDPEEVIRSYAWLQALGSLSLLVASLLWESCLTGALTFDGRYWVTGSIAMIGFLLISIRVTLRDASAKQIEQQNPKAQPKVPYIGTYYIGITIIDAWCLFASAAITMLVMLIVFSTDAKDPLYSILTLVLVPIYMIVCTVANWNKPGRSTGSNWYNLLTAIYLLTAIIMIPVIHYSEWKEKGIIMLYSICPVIMLYVLGLVTSVPALIPSLSYDGSAI